MQYLRVIPKHNGLRSLLKIISRSNCNDLKKILAEIIPLEQEKIKQLRTKYDNTKVGDITIKSLYSGMRGLVLLPTETSQLDSKHGIHFRGYTLQQCCQYLPKSKSGGQPLPESIFWLLCTGKMPTDDQVKFLSNEWAERASLPCHVVNMLDNFPKTLHPMSQLTAAMIALNHDSKFAKAYSNGIPKSLYWEYIYEDAMDLIAKVIVVAATIYVNVFREGKGKFAVDCEADWTHNFMKMIGYDSTEEFINLMRLYFTLHADHEGGNVSAHTVHLVGSALSDPYLSYAAGMNGLAGPLHGLANQGFLQFIEQIIKELSVKPTDQQLTDFVWKTLKSGRVIPGFGHADLRSVDPRYTVLSEFGQTYMSENELVQLAVQLNKLVPNILKETGKVNSPWPNVDAHSGVLLHSYGMTEKSFYTVLFAVSRALGVMASLIWDRAFQLPIERPKSLSSYNLLKFAEKEADQLKTEIKVGSN